jgi:hypothetical protein
MSGLTKPSEILRERVEPALKEYLEEPLSERRANILAKELDAHLEWTYEYCKQTDPSRLDVATLTSFRTDLLKQHRALHVMSDLADCARHRFLDRPRDPPRVVKSSTSAYYEEAGVLHVQGFNSPFASEARQAFEFWRNRQD